MLGASGDLAKKKTFPALFGLYKNHYLDANTQIIGYARTKMDQSTFEGHISKYIKLRTDEDKEALPKFLKLCSYQDGQYDKDQDFQVLEKAIEKLEKASGATARLFYMALPPSVFIPVATSIKHNNYKKGVIIRLIVEKPFGMDLESSRQLAKDLGALFTEDEVKRSKNWKFIFVIACVCEKGDSF